MICAQQLIFLQFLTPAHPHAQSLFLFPIVFGINYNYSSNSPRPAATRRLHGQGGLEERLLRCHNSGGSPRSPAVPVMGPTLRVPVLPFGLAPAPRVFTKVLRPVVATLCQMGIRLVIYIDDVLIMAESEDISSAHCQMVLDLLLCLSFSLSWAKRQLTPSKLWDFLDIRVDSKRMQFI